MRIIRALAVAIVAAALVVGAAMPASAHDELVSSSPTSGQHLDQAPATVSLVFSAGILPIGAAIVVADGSDVDWVDGAPDMQGDTVTATIKQGMPGGAYELRWRVVSSDGHPISGLIPFTVGSAAPTVQETATPRDTAAPAPEASQSAAPSAPESQATPYGQAAPDNQGILRLVLIGVLGAAVAAALFAGILILSRRRQRGAPDAPGHESADREDS